MLEGPLEDGGVREPPGEYGLPGASEDHRPARHGEASGLEPAPALDLVVCRLRRGRRRAGEVPSPRLDLVADQRPQVTATSERVGVIEDEVGTRDDVTRRAEILDGHLDRVEAEGAQLAQEELVSEAGGPAGVDDGDGGRRAGAHLRYR